MSHEEVQELVQQYSESGGIVHRLPESAVTIDWSKNARFSHVAQTMSNLGHKKRWRKEKRPA